MVLIISGTDTLHKTLPLEFLPDGPDIYYDLEIENVEELYLFKIEKMIRETGPYGVGNPAPVFFIRDLELYRG